MVCFFGDGASNEGTFHEALNMATVWNLPVVFVCENNQYGMSVPWQASHQAARHRRPRLAYGIPGEAVDGMDVLAVREAVATARARARRRAPP